MAGKIRMAAVIAGLVGFLLLPVAGFAAYHHEGERDSDKFLSVYPDKKGTKLDHCATCHSGGSYESKGKMTSLGSCQWCHYTYGYDASGNILDTMNQYGKDFHDAGRNEAAVEAIEGIDSDGDGYTNIAEIAVDRFPGDPNDDPGKTEAPYRIYTKAQVQALGQHTQFLLMNTSRSGDFYAQYTGAPMKDLLADAGMLPSATGILVYAPDGWSQYHPIENDPDPEMYPVNGPYPSSVYYYDPEADQALNPTDGWCDYSAPSCAGRNHLDPISVTGGLKMILAFKREGLALDPGVLNVDNKLDGEGPFRVVPPQKNASPPDQSSRAPNQDVVWPYDYDWDHNAGAATKTVTIIKVQPLPEGTTDINVLEAGWSYVDQEKVIVYGAIDGTDSNGNGVLDSEEGIDETADFDGDGIPDYKDPDTARVRPAHGGDKILIHTSEGQLSGVRALGVDDPEVSQVNKPDGTFPFGTVRFDVTGVANGATVTITLVFPGNVPVNAEYYKISASGGWNEIPFGSNDGDNRITLSLTDGDPKTDLDGAENGVIKDPGAVAVPTQAAASGGGGSSGCFIDTVGTAGPAGSFSATRTGAAFLFLLATLGMAALARRGDRRG